MTCYHIAPNACLSQLILINQREDFKEVVREVAESGYVFMDTISDFTISYKGVISWVVVAFNNKGYLVDALALRSEMG
jgi:hypothetical protein